MANNFSSSLDPISELLTTYAELNRSEPVVLEESPSPLEFSRFVGANRPFIVRGGAAEWRATKMWNKKHLKNTLRNQLVKVAITPSGNADSALACDNGSLLFVKPLEEDQSFTEFLDYVNIQELTGRAGHVRYAQTQNDNLRGEYTALFADVEKDIPWARIALGRGPEAINLWIGNSKSVTALHKDPYENIYCQIVGEKHFVLLPPLAYACIAEKALPSASYVRQGDELVLSMEEESIPFATWDPDKPEKNRTKYSHMARPIRATLKAGDMLYLPALWYHKVSQSCSAEGFSCSVNYWHDLSFDGNFYPSCLLARNVALLSREGD